MPIKKQTTKKATKKSREKARSAAVRRGSPASLKDFCRTLPGTTEDIKWGDHLIFSLGGRMYAAFSEDHERNFAFKCSDEDFDRLIEFDGVIPAPYMAKSMWVSVRDRSALGIAECRTLLKEAHKIILGNLPKRTQRSITGAE